MKNDINLLDEEITANTPPAQRPVFLTVLCILTFVGAGLAIISALFSVLTMGQIESSFGQMNEALSEVDMDFSNSYRWVKISYVLNLCGGLLCLAGALFMWKLKKIGFFIYILGQLLPLFGSFMTMNSINLGVFAGFGIVMTVIGMLFPIAFIIMYGLNLKHMK